MADETKLFSKIPIHLLTKHWSVMLTEEIDDLRDVPLFAGEARDLAAELVREIVPSVPVLDLRAASYDEVEVNGEEAGWCNDDAEELKPGERGTIYRIFVPFLGTPSVFNYIPTTAKTVPPFADVEGQDLVIKVFVGSKPIESAAILKDAKWRLSRIASTLDQLKIDLDGVHGDLSKIAEIKIATRRTKRQRDVEIGNGLGLPRRRTSSKALSRALPVDELARSIHESRQRTGRVMVVECDGITAQSLVMHTGFSEPLADQVDMLVEAGWAVWYNQHRHYHFFARWPDGGGPAPDLATVAEN